MMQKKSREQMRAVRHGQKMERREIRAERDRAREAAKRRSNGLWDY